MLLEKVSQPSTESETNACSSRFSTKAPQPAALKQATLSGNFSG